MNAVLYLMRKREIKPSDILLQGSEYKRVLAVLERFVNRTPQEFMETCEQVLSRYGMNEEEISNRPHAFHPREDEVDYNRPGHSTVDPAHVYEWDNTILTNRSAA